MILIRCDDPLAWTSACLPRPKRGERHNSQNAVHRSIVDELLHEAGKGRVYQSQPVRNVKHRTGKSDRAIDFMEKSRSQRFFLAPAR